MERQRQLAILDRVMAHRAAGNTTDMAPDMYANPVDTYVDPRRYEAEVDRLFRGCPIVACLAADVARPGDHVTLPITGIPVQVVRGRDGALRAFRNGRDGPDRAGCGSGDGSAEMACDEAAGLVLVHVDGDPGSLDAAAWLGEIGVELSQFDLGGFSHFETRHSTRAMNWKLMADTFCEQYHLRHLHHASLAPTVQSDNSLYDAYGLHGRMVTPCWSIEELDDRPRHQWPLFPHVILNYMIVPNTVLLVQGGFIELFQFLPEGAERTTSVTTLYAAEPAVTERARRRLTRAFDLLLGVVDNEDYVMCEQTQRGFRSGAQRHIVFGRNEPGLIHYHRSVEELLHRPAVVAPDGDRVAPT
jgi:phenylpropionate dioxygenase-like ring-hydroxylating dioxygenase large terminal subunit